MDAFPTYLDQLDEERDALVPPLTAEDLEPVTPIAVPPQPTSRVPQVPVGAEVPALSVKPYGEGADAAALAAAEADRAQTDQAAKLLDASHSFNKAFGGSLESTAPAARATRDQGFQDVVRRRALADQDLERAKLTRDTGLAAALERGDSPESVKIKEMFSGTQVGQRLRGSMGEDAWARLPGKAIPGAKEQLASETSLLMAGLKAQAKAGKEGDEREVALKALVDLAGGPDSPEGQRYIQAFDKAPTALIKTLGGADLSRGFQAGQNDLSRQATIKAAQIAAGRQDEKAREGQTEDIAKETKEGSGFGTNLKIINDVLSKAKATKSGDVPGIGPIDAAKNEYFHGFLERNPEGQRLNKAARSLMLAYRNLVTGSAASNQEDQRISQAGLDFVNETAFRTGLQNMSARYYDLLKRTYAGKDPRAVQMFIARNPDYEIPGDSRFGAGIAKKAAAKYSALSNMADIRPGLVELEGLKGSGPGPGAPEVDTGTPITEPGGAAAPVPAEAAPTGKVRVRNKQTGAVGRVTPPFDPTKYELVP